MRGIVSDVCFTIVEKTYDQNIVAGVLKNSNLPSDSVCPAAGDYRFKALFQLLTNQIKFADIGSIERLSFFRYYLCNVHLAGHADFTSRYNNPFGIIQTIKDCICSQLTKRYAKAQLFNCAGFGEYITKLPMVYDAVREAYVMICRAVEKTLGYFENLVQLDVCLATNLETEPRFDFE